MNSIKSQLIILAAVLLFAAFAAHRSISNQAREEAAPEKKLQSTEVNSAIQNSNQSQDSHKKIPEQTTSAKSQVNQENDQSKLLTQVSELFSEANRLHDNPTLVDARIHSFVSSLNRSQIQQIGDIAIQKNDESGQRSFAIYLLGLSKEDVALDALAKVIEQPLPIHPSEEEQDRELLLHEMALNELADLIPRTDTRRLEFIAETSPVPAIRSSARHLLQAVQNGGLLALRAQEDQLLRRAAGGGAN